MSMVTIVVCLSYCHFELRMILCVAVLTALENDASHIYDFCDSNLTLICHEDKNFPHSVRKRAWVHYSRYIPVCERTVLLPRPSGLMLLETIPTVVYTPSQPMMLELQNITIECSSWTWLSTKSTTKKFLIYTVFDNFSRFTLGYILQYTSCTHQGRW